MARRDHQRAAREPEAPRPVRDRRGTVAIALSALALGVAVVALGLVATRPSTTDLTACRTAAWDALPQAGALPSGWSPGSTVYGVDSAAVTLVGADPSSGATSPLAYVSISCYGDTAGDALTRSHDAALAAGGSDLPFVSLGDASFAVQDPANGSVAVYIERGRLVASIAASSSVAPADLEQSARAVDAAMQQAESSAGLAAGSPSSASAAPSVGPSASGAAASGPPSNPSPAPSPTGPSHVSPDLEALLPVSIDGVAMSTQSGTGTSALSSGAWAQALVDAVTGLGKTSDDLEIAVAYDPNGGLGVYVFAFRLGGVDSATLKAAVLQSWLAAAPTGQTTSTVTMSGKTMTKIAYADGGADDYVYEHGDVVFDIETTADALASAAAAELP